METEDALDTMLIAEEIFTTLTCTADENDGGFRLSGEDEQAAEQLAEKSFVYAQAFVERRRQFIADNNLI